MSSARNMTSFQKKWWIAGLLGVLILALMVIVFSWSSEPEYQGKRLSLWAQQYELNQEPGKWGGVAYKEAQSAIRAIGTNGVPFLLSLLQRRESLFLITIGKIAPARWNIRLSSEMAVDRSRALGAYGFAALGSNATFAIPSLIDIAKNHPDMRGRYHAVFALRTLQDAGEPAMPFFLECLTNKDSNIRNEAVTGLRYMHHQTDVIIPLLIQHLERCKSAPTTSEAIDTIETLSRFGTNAKAAVPVVLYFLNTKDDNLRECVTNRLEQLDPQMTNVSVGIVR